MKVPYVQRNEHHMIADLFSEHKLYNPEENLVRSLKQGKQKEYL